MANRKGWQPPKVYGKDNPNYQGAQRAAADDGGAPDGGRAAAAGDFADVGCPDDDYQEMQEREDAARDDMMQTLTGLREKYGSFISFTRDPRAEDSADPADLADAASRAYVFRDDNSDETSPQDRRFGIFMTLPETGDREVDDAWRRTAIGNLEKIGRPVGSAAAHGGPLAHFPVSAVAGNYSRDVDGDDCFDDNARGMEDVEKTIEAFHSFTRGVRVPESARDLIGFSEKVTSAGGRPMLSGKMQRGGGDFRGWKASQEVSIQDADFSGCDLEGASIHTSMSSSFRDAENLDSTSWNVAMRNDYSGQTIDGATFDNAIACNFRGATLRNVTINNSFDLDLSETTLENCTIDGEKR